MNRRQFLQSAALIPVALSAAEPNVSFPGEARDRLAVASYPFRRDIHGGKMDLPQFAQMVVSRYKLHHIEPLDQHFKSVDPVYLAGLRESFAKTGVAVVNIPCSPHHSLWDPDEKVRAAGVENGKKWVDAAAALGSPSIRLHLPGARGVSPDAARAADSLKQVAQYGESKNIVVNLENDDPRSEDAFFLVKVIEAVHSPFLRALPDFCNSMLLGDENYNGRAVTAMFKYAYNISHMKDSESDGKKLYRIDVSKIFAIAKRSGYRGYFSMEWDTDGDPYAGTERLIDESLKNLA